MKESRYTGWRKVFLFTLIQTLKTPAMIVSIVVLFVLALISMPVMGLMNNTETPARTETSIEKLVIADETSLKLARWLDLSKMETKNVLPEKIEFTDEDPEKLMDSLAQEEEQAWAMIEISHSMEEMSFSIVGAYGTGTAVDKDELVEITDLIAANIQGQMVDQLGISQEQVDYIEHEVVQDISYYSVGEDGQGSITEEEEHISSLTPAEYSIVLVCLVVVTMLISMNGEQVASAILQEKSSKVVEYLLINVKPLALMVGKILAIFVVTLGQLLLMAAGFALSAAAYLIMNPDSTLTLQEMISMMMGGTAAGEAAITFNFAAVPIVIILILAGALFYSTIAALAGASVSRMEELTEGMKMFSLIMIVGAYGAMAVVMADMMGSAPIALARFVELCPLTSPFITPGYLLLDKMSFTMGIISLVIFIIALILLFMFSAAVYETLIYHKGNPLKLKDLINIFRGAKEDKR